MSSNTLQDYAKQALDCTERMLLLAEQQDWQALATLEIDRSILLGRLFEHPNLPDMLSKLADTLRLIIELDQKTIALSQSARDTLKSELSLLVQGKKAVHAYLD